ncbi:ATP-dependent helicase [Mastigocoleus testarum]|uniref:DNA 3'-5' helicase n=1 Tax=Mastigocoleus testarum BC008 TaxID=371196 RepID=A0A0V7ZPT4_9CYAN|nr:ATP-dependent helicase [Mastigocoleus testarum]KST66359.1 DNA helicase UvrD [Mastigocoleus testarum BC008]KST66680.1 DNA helicase UvrD [Mastigocoleus testarum BC008]
MSDANFTDTVPTEPLDTELSARENLASPREQAINNIRNSLRHGQQQMVDWQGGPLAVSAVPGAGKSTGMAAAAAIAIARQYQRSNSSRPNVRRQLVVVTFTRSAAANIKAKIRKYLRDDLSLPQTGFVVHTLHGLALNIASRHPNLSGLELDRLTLITPNQGHRLIRTSVEHWITNNQSQYYRLVEGMQFDGEETERLRRQSVIRTEVLPDLASTVIHEAKSSGLSPEDLQILSRQTQDEYGILSIASGLYDQYETLMRDREFIDYDDMILAALRVLDNPSARRIEQNQVFAVFEDEAQDSSPLQTQLLQILATEGLGTGDWRLGTGSGEQGDEEQGAGSRGQTIITQSQIPNGTRSVRSERQSLINLVRVGDPNQAINSTFTPADPIYFREFCQECQAKNRLATMDRAGRSTSIVIEAANFALQWVNSLYSSQNKKAKQQRLQAESLATAKLPFRDQNIHLVEPEDPQPNANPQAIGQGLELHKPRDIHHTVELISQRIIELFSEDESDTITGAILVRENRQGRWLGEVLKPICKEHGINLYDVSEQERHSHVPEEILAILNFCDRPHSPDYLKAALAVMVQRRIIETQDLNALASLPEDFLYPGPLAPPQTEPVQKAAQICRSLLRARLELPVYHLISFIGLTLNYEQAELATADKLAERIAIQIAGNLSLGEMLRVLSEIVSSERFEPVDTEDSEARYTRPGQLTIITMHKAKGLDWDYVFMPFLHENLIPGRFWVPPQRQFLGSFTLSEVARAQIRAALHDEPRLPNVTEAWEQAKYLKIAEEYRLLYVAMTRAKRLLWMSAAKEAPFTWSKPDNLQKQAVCPVFPALTREFGEYVVD